MCKKVSIKVSFYLCRLFGDALFGDALFVGSGLEVDLGEVYCEI